MATPSEEYIVSKLQAIASTTHSGVGKPATKWHVFLRGNSSQMGANSTEPPGFPTSAHGTAVIGTGMVQCVAAQGPTNTSIKLINAAPSQTQG